MFSIMERYFRSYCLRLVAAIALLLTSALSADAVNIQSYRFHQMPETSYYGGINSIAKDSIGRMWFSGTDALYMFNGRMFKNIVVPNPRMEVAVDFRAIKVRNDGKLFVAANVGLFSFDYKTEKMVLERQGDISAIDTDSDGRIWMLAGSGLFLVDNENGEYRQWALPEDCNSGTVTLSCSGKSAYVGNAGKLYCFDTDKFEWALWTDFTNRNIQFSDVLKTDDGIFVLTLKDGLYECDASGAVTRAYRLPQGYDKSSTAKELFLDEKGVVWVATQSGLQLIEPSTGESYMLTANLFDIFALPNNSVWSIYPDPDGGVWVGTYGGKLAYLSFSDNDIRSVHPTPGGLSHPIVSSFAEDNDGNLWVGTEGGGISIWNRKAGNFSVMRQEDGNSLNSNMIKRLVCDGEYMWIAAFNGGIMRKNLRTGRLEDLKILNQNTGRPLSVYDFETETDGIWVADPDAELMFWDGHKTENVIFYDADGKKIRMRVEGLFHNGMDNLVLVTHSGVHVMDVQSRKLIEHHIVPNESYAANNLCCWCRTSTSDLWFGTRGAGVNRLDAQENYTNLNASDDGRFVGRTVFGILEDKVSKNVWFSTDAGLFYYDAKDGKIVHSDIDETIRCGAYYVRSCFCTSNSEMLFGGTDGFIMFNPENFKVNPQKPRVYFTELKINDKNLSLSDSDSPIKQAVSTLNGLDGRKYEIDLSHRQSNFEIGFASNSYLEPQRNRYSYRMRGVSDNWIELPAGQQNVRFVNLAPGKYRFEIRCANSDGVWGDKVSSLSFRLHPSPLLSPLAYAVYIILALLAVFLTWVYMTRKKMLEKSLEVEKEKEKNLRELTQARINFFTNISHDLKTPLTLVVDPLKQLEKTLPEDAPSRKYVDAIGHNVVRIQRMIGELLKFRQIETLKLPMDLKSGDIVKFVESIFSLFEFYASSRHIETEFISSIDSYMTRFDYDVIEKVFTNLISNAVKYTTENGYVNVRVCLASAPEGRQEVGVDWLSFSVTNSGSEISKDRYETIFEPFNNAGGKASTCFESHTGLGLAIVKELVNDMKGTISVSSADSTVSFTVLLPFVHCADAVADESAVESEGSAYEYAASEIDNLIYDINQREHVDEKRGRKQYDVLVIEDDAELRNYLDQRLSQSYNVYTAMNGRDGIAKIEKIMPHIVVTDLVMPEMDGFEVCRRIREDISTSHIPVIMLSAAGENRTAQIDALEYGANVFIDKPVDIDFLQKQIDSLIRSQNKLKEIYSKKYVAEPSKITISSVDEDLIRKAVSFIEKNFENENYGVDDFVSDMAIGRTRLYQKITDLTGMSIKEFILDIRLKRASQLLKESEYTVAEISTMTGFANPKYFSVCFKRHFGQTPTEFKANSDAK